MEVREPQGGPGIRILRSPSLAKIRGKVCGTTKVIFKKKNQTTERLLLIWVPWALRNAFLLRLLLLPVGELGDLQISRLERVFKNRQIFGLSCFDEALPQVLGIDSLHGHVRLVDGQRSSHYLEMHFHMYTVDSYMNSFVYS